MPQPRPTDQNQDFQGDFPIFEQNHQITFQHVDDPVRLNVNSRE